MTAWGVTAACAVLALATVGCSSDGGGSAAVRTTTEPTSPSSTTTTSTAPERPSSTTTTAYDPAAVEGQVEAAYLKSWDVYADAVYNLVLDEAALSEVYAEEALTTQINEINRRIAEARPSLVSVEHQYQIALSDPGTANVVDEFINHQVRIDPNTKQPIEADPNAAALLNFKMRLIDGAWKVVFIQRVTS